MKKTPTSPRAMSSGDAPLPGSWDGEGTPAASPSESLSVNALLHSQLLTLRSEKAELSTALTAARLQLVETERQLETERRELAGVSGSDVAAARVLELSRRVRHLTAELESERTRCRRLEARAAATVAPPPPEPARPEPAPSAVSGDEETVPQLRDKLRETTRRLVEARNQAQATRRELRQAEKLLQQEVGDSATLQSLLAAGTGWRGRAQQIVTLRAQLVELQERQSLATSSGDGAAAVSAVRSEPRLSAADSRARSHIQSLEREQRAAARQQAEESQRLAEENAQLKQKLEAARSRAAAQTRELAQLREATARLQEKGSNDNEMIETLTAQLRLLEAKLTENDRAVAAARRPPPPPLHGQQVSLLRAQLAARDQQVARLQEELATRPEPEPKPRTPSPAPPAEEVSELRRRCLEAQFLQEAAVAERARLSEQQRHLRTRLSESERRLEEMAAILLREQEEAAGSRREVSRLQQVLGRGRRPAPRQEPTPEQEQGPAQQELVRLRQELERQRKEREQDLRQFEETMEEARQIFCRGLQEAVQGAAAGGSSGS